MIPSAASPDLPDPDFWNERPTRSHRRRRRSRSQRVGRVRSVAALALVGGLAVAWAVTARHPAPRRLAVRSKVAALPASVPTSSAPAPQMGDLLRELLPAGARCDGKSTAGDTTRCTLARVDVDYRLVARGALRSEYLTAVLPGFAGGPAALGAGSGAPACARGAEDERAWSRPGAPRLAVGRYACRIERGRAAMWWTVDDRGLLAHATAADIDLTSLFAWWESHSER